MQKVKYHKLCRKHEHVKKVKAMINRALTKYETLHESFWFPLTGVLSEDAFHFNWLVNDRMEKLSRFITADLKRTKDERQNYLELDKYHLLLCYVIDLQQIKYYIQENYPVNPKRYVFQFSDPDAPISEKKNEYKHHFDVNPIIGFNPKWHLTYKDGKIRQVFSLTATPNDLDGCTQIEVVYE